MKSPFAGAEGGALLVIAILAVIAVAPLFKMFILATAKVSLGHV
jgi:hypothetical protein